MINARSVRVLVFGVWLIHSTALLFPLPTSRRYSFPLSRKATPFQPESIIIENEETLWPVPQTPYERMARAATFWWKISPMITGYCMLLTELSVRQALKRPIEQQEAAQKWEVQHEQGSKLLSETLNEMQGFYAKTGNSRLSHLATLI